MTAGLHATITDGKRRRTPCLITGPDVPRIHHSDGVPVFHIIEHEDGIPIRLKNGQLRNLLAYPSHWPVHGRYHADEWVYARHELLPWDALIPCFTGSERLLPAAPPETITEACDRLAMPLPAKL